MRLHIKSDFDCVYLVNGEIVEAPADITMREHDVVYVTAFPLGLQLLPYTVKLCGGEGVKSELYVGTRLDEGHYLLSLSARHIAVYGAPQKPPPPSSLPARLFLRIKSGDTDGAYAMLSPSLRDSIDKNALADFFAGYERICDCDWDSSASFYLIDGAGNAKKHSYTVKDGLIDNIIEL